MRLILVFAVLFLSAFPLKAVSQIATIALSEGKYVVASVTKSKSPDTILRALIRDCSLRHGTTCTAGSRGAWASGQIGKHRLEIITCITSVGEFRSYGSAMPQNTSSDSAYATVLHKLKLDAQKRGETVNAKTCKIVASFQNGRFFDRDKKISPTIENQKFDISQLHALKGTRWCARNSPATSQFADTVCIKLNRFEPKGSVKTTFSMFKNGSRK